MVQPFIPPPKEIYQRGVKVITAELTRHDPRRKDTGFINESEPMRAKVDGDVYEALLTKQGKIYEGMTSNFYAVVYPFVVSEAKQSPPPQKRLLRRDEHPPRNDGILMTARFGILLGVTRRAILRLARGQGLGIQYRPPRLDEDFAEAFLTSSSRGVVPIVQIDGRPVGAGGPGQWTKLLVKAYAAYVDERSEVILPAILVV